MAFDLADLARQNGLRKNRVLRGIEITDTLKRDLYRIVVRPVQAWERQVIDRIRPAYGQALSTLTRDDESDDLADAIRIAEAQAAGATVMVDAEVRGWVLDALRWHEQRWADAVKAGTGIDVFPFIDRKENAARVKAFQSQIANLVKDVDAKTKKEIADTVWRGFAEGKPRKKIAKELTERIGIARRRANTIAVDQAQKLNGELTRIRMGEAGVEWYKWRHSRKRRFRPAHKRRDGKLYRLGQPAGDEPGYRVYCGCVSEPVVDVENNAAEMASAGQQRPPTAPMLDDEFNEVLERTLKESEEWAEKAVRKKLPKRIHAKGTGAYYSPRDHSIFMQANMPDYSKAPVMRHELGHSVDMRGLMLGQRSDKLTTAAKKDFQALLKIEADYPGPDLFAVSSSARKAAAALTPTKELADDVVQLMQARDPTFISIISREIAIASKNEVGREWTFFADLLEAVSRTRYGYGHGPQYYARFKKLADGYTQGHMAEAYANWFALTGGPNSAAWTELVEMFVPEFARAARKTI